MGNKPDRQGERDRRIGFPEVMAVSGKEGWLARASRMLDLPGDVVAGLPRIELIGSGELRMEGHRGILAYGPVKGSGLELGAMDPTQLLITGEISSVELV